MARYDYKCNDCELVQEVVHGMTENPEVKCPECEGICVRQIGVPNVVLGKTCREVWHYDEVHKYKPKWLKSKDGKTRVRYDETKHGGHKGCQSHLRRDTQKISRRVSSESSESSEDAPANN